MDRLVLLQSFMVYLEGCRVVEGFPGFQHVVRLVPMSRVY